MKGCIHNSRFVLFFLFFYLLSGVRDRLQNHLVMDILIIIIGMMMDLASLKMDDMVLFQYQCNYIIKNYFQKCIIIVIQMIIIMIQIMFQINMTLITILMYNFCVYIHRLPTGGTTNNELYLVKQHHSLKNTLYTDIYDGNNDQVKLPLLKNFNYFEAKSSLMRSATNYHLSACVLLLVKDGHSCNVINRRADRVTALQFARQQNLFEILSHFSRFGDAEREAKKDEMKDDSKEKEQTSSSSSKASTRMNEKSLELRYDGFMNQSMAAKYFLVKLGCKMRNEAEISGVEHKLLEYDHQGRTQCKGHYSDDFYCSLSDLVGLQTNDDGSDLYGSRSPEMAMRTIVSSVISILSLKMIVSQDLLIICVIYCTQFCDKNNAISRQFLMH